MEDLHSLAREESVAGIVGGSPTERAFQVTVILLNRCMLTCFLVNMDDFLSRWRMTNFQHEDVLSTL